MHVPQGRDHSYSQGMNGCSSHQTYWELGEAVLFAEGGVPNVIGQAVLGHTYLSCGLVRNTLSTFAVVCRKAALLLKS